MKNKKYAKYLRWMLNNLSILVIIFLLVKVIDVNFKYKIWLEEDEVIQWDVKSYYSYLPATFIYGDISLGFLKDNKEVYDKIWPVTTEEGDTLIVTSSGLSMMYSPFFLLGHVYSLNSDYVADGYSVPYRFALVFAAFFYLLIGLIFLRKTLKLFFRDFVVAFVLLAIAMGTNLFYYSTHEAAMSHVFSFSLISIFVFLSIRWHENPNWKRTVIIGLIFGLIVLVRPTNILVLLFFILWDVKSWGELWNRIVLFLRRFDLVILMFVFFLLVWVPQFLYWKTVTGQWLYYSYGAKDASFFFLNPQIYNILISYKKGWFVYTPMMAVAFISIFFMLKSFKKAFWSVLIYILAMIYVLSSWWSWWYGGGFGLRAFVDTYAVMAIPLASIIDQSLRKKWIAAFLLPLLGALIWFNMFQVRQYHNMAIHWWWMNKDAYWETFLKEWPTKKYWDLITIPDYEKARRGVYIAVKPQKLEKREIVKKVEKEYRYLMVNDTVLYDSLKKVAINNDQLNKIINTLIKKNLNSYIYRSRKDVIDSIAKRISGDKALYERALKEARRRNISVDSMLTLNAIYIFRH